MMRYSVKKLKIKEIRKKKKDYAHSRIASAKTIADYIQNDINIFGLAPLPQ
jgi:hypothetical protein